MSRAKESFLERLKREREEALKPKEEPAPSVETYHEDSYRESYVSLPKIEKDVSSDESSEEEEEIVPQKPVWKAEPVSNGYGYVVS